MRSQPWRGVGVVRRFQTMRPFTTPTPTRGALWQVARDDAHVPTDATTLDVAGRLPPGESEGRAPSSVMQSSVEQHALPTHALPMLGR